METVESEDFPKIVISATASAVEREAVGVPEERPKIAAEPGGHGKHFTCQICGKNDIKTRKYLRTHSLRKHKIAPELPPRDSLTNRTCTICDKVFAMRYQLREHLLLHTGEKPHQCEVCGLKFRLSNSLYIHLETHRASNRVKCKVCGRVFKSQRRLGQHHRYRHVVEERMCDLCGKFFQNKGSYEQHHLKEHQEVVTQRCTVCNKQVAKNYMKRHQQTHIGFKCRICSKLYRSANGLKRHEMVHRGIYPYKCRFCKKTFTDLAIKREHMKIHYGVKGFKCQTCNRTFGMESNLRIHMRLHTGDIPFECKICHKKYNYVRNLKTHHINCHPDDQ